MPDDSVRGGEEKIAEDRQENGPQNSGWQSGTPAFIYLCHFTTSHQNFCGGNNPKWASHGRRKRPTKSGRLQRKQNAVSNILDERPA